MIWRPLDKETFENPFPMYKKLREESPIFKAHTGEWVVTGYDEVKSILKDSQFLVGNKKEWLERSIKYFDQKDVDLKPIAEAINTFILLINPPDHTRIRKLIMTAWDNRNVEDIIVKNIKELIQPLKSFKTFDVVESFASHLPAMTIAEIMGISIKEYLHLRDAGREMVKSINPYNTYKDLVNMNAASKHFIAFFRQHIQQKKSALGNDLISKIIAINKNETQPLNESELISICIFLFVAGEETTIGTVSSSILTLGQHPAQRKLIKSDDQWQNAIDELLRYNGPVHLLGRLAPYDFNYMGHDMKSGEVITLCPASANRDKKQFENPNELILNRTPNRHLAFGSGIHFCLGDWLAKIQTRLSLQYFLEEFPTYKVDPSSISWTNNLSIRSLEKLKVMV